VYVQGNQVVSPPDIPAGGTCPNAISPYGIAFARGESGDGWIFVTDAVCKPDLYRYDIAAGEWSTHTVSDDSSKPGTPRGLAADRTHLWVSSSHQQPSFTYPLDNRVIQFDLAGMTRVGSYAVPEGPEQTKCESPIGVGIDFKNRIWAVCFGSQVAARLDPATSEWVRTSLASRNPSTNVWNVPVNPYTYSDFIGYSLNVLAEASGKVRYVVEGCSDLPTRWEGVTIDGIANEGASSITYRVHSADTREGLEAAPWLGPFAVLSTDFKALGAQQPRGRFLEIEITLTSLDGNTAPVVSQVHAVVACEEMGAQ
jgi:hypothetical protein